MTTPNLQIAHIPADPTQGEVDANAALDDLDEASNSRLMWVIDGDQNVTTASIASAFLHVLQTDGGSPDLAADFQFILTAGRSRFFAVDNQTLFACSVTSTGSPQIPAIVRSGEKGLIHFDGDQARLLGAAVPFSVGFMGTGVITEGALIGRYSFVEHVRFLANFEGSRGFVGTAPDNGVSFSIRKNDVEIGTMPVESLANAPTFVLSAAEDFAPGDTMELVAPAGSPNETTMADVNATITGIRL